MPTAIRRRTALALAALCALALPLAGCVRADFGVAVREDGGGDFAITVAVSASQLEDFGVPAEAIVDDAMLQAAGADSAAEVTSYRDGDWVGTTARWSEDDAAAGLERWTENALFRSVSLTRGDGGGWSFEAVAMTAVAVPDDVAEQLDGFGGLDAAQVAAGSEVRFRLALPGALVRHNADEEDGGALTWLLPSDGGEDIRLFAVTAGGGAPPPPTATPPPPSAAAAGTATPTAAASTPTATPSPTPAPSVAASTPAATPASVAAAPSPSPPPEPAIASAEGSGGGGGRLAVAAAIALALAALLGLAAWRVRRARAAR